VRVELGLMGTLEGAEIVASSPWLQIEDTIWFSSNRYLALGPEAYAKLGSSADIMSSPVVFGLRRSVAEGLGWVGRPVTWAEIAAAAGARQFSFGMTDPSTSDSGLSAVVAVATALVGTGSALTIEQAESTVPALRHFFAAQTLTAASSGVLRDAYARRATGADPGEPVDGLINYESVLLGMNASWTLPEPLELIYPADGVVTAEYPLTVLAGASAQDKEAHRRLIDYLRTPDVQRAIAERTFRRPAVPGVAGPQTSGILVELPFPAEVAVVDALLMSSFDRLRRPSRTIYLLDTSWSPASDDRVRALEYALGELASAPAYPTLTATLARVPIREEVTLLPFNDHPHAPLTIRVAKHTPGPDWQRIIDAAAALKPAGGTAIYDSLQAAYRIAEQEIAADPDRITSIVLLTDGANTRGSDLEAFRAFAASLPTALRDVPTFCVLFEEGQWTGLVDIQEMEEVARLTGGRMFNAGTPLADVFRAIREHV
jgi:Ca-activated chloride channel family protein